MRDLQRAEASYHKYPGSTLACIAPQDDCETSAADLKAEAHGVVTHRSRVLVTLQSVMDRRAGGVSYYLKNWYTRTRWRSSKMLTGRAHLVR